MFAAVLGCRSTRRLLVSLTGLFCGLVGALPATGQTATAPAFDPAIQTRAAEVLAKSLATYRQAKTYSDKLKVRSEILGRDKQGDEARQLDEYDATLAYAAPRKVRLEDENHAIYANEQHLSLYASIIEQYVQRDAPAELKYTEWREQIPMPGNPPHPILHALSQGDVPFEQIFPTVRGFTAIAPEQRNSQPGLRVSGVFDATALGFSGEAPFSLWIADKTGLVEEIRLELTEMLRADVKAQLARFDLSQVPPGVPTEIESATLAVTFEDPRLDVDIPAEQFAFAPPKDAEKVAAFPTPAELAAMMNPDPRALVGKPAPLFDGHGMDKQPLSLEALRGQVVVLDFWATWCGPCVAAMPHIQKVHEQFAEKLVSVIGVNQDGPQTANRVEPFLKQTKVTFRQFLDPKAKVGRKYNVNGIPCTFVIDQAGVVQAVHQGLEPNLATRLADEIERLLAGKGLTKPATDTGGGR